MGIQKIMIVGSGLLGSGIAQVCAQAGLDVLLSDVSHEALEKALKNIEWSVGKLVDKGILEDTRSTILNRISTIQDLASGGGGCCHRGRYRQRAATRFG
jgi:3-hydroxybutyryl-CoA dehydrogenase